MLCLPVHGFYKTTFGGCIMSTVLRRIEAELSMKKTSSQTENVDFSICQTDL